jgi:diphthine synthase
VKRCKHVFLEAYTSILAVDTAVVEELYGRPVIVADRSLVELNADAILADAKDEDVAFCVVGDPFGATTHTDLALRAAAAGVQFKTIHNASIMNAVGSCGLQLYRFGQTVSIVFFTETWKPESFYDKILANLKLGLHTLCLLDIKVKEPTEESLARGKPVYAPPRYMTVNTCIEQLFELEERRGEGVLTQESQCVGLARMGAEDQCIVAGSAKQLRTIDFGGPLHSFVICGDMDEFEQQMLDMHRVPEAHCG